ncbi:GGDEF domain-containing protein [Comamonas sp. F1-6]|uniref:GGDEF domain-containing protein n=1 Tax=Comamonas sp. F1-6 TaxID=673550 RepID=UPI0031D1EBE8
MSLHVPSFAFINALILATLAVCLGLITRREHKNGMVFWGLALTAICGAHVLYMLRQQVNDGFSVVLGNILLTAAFSLMLEGFHQVQGSKPARLLIWFPVLVVCMFFPLLLKHAAIRGALLMTLLCFQIVLFGRTIFRQWHETPGRGKFFLLAGVALSMIALLTKASAVLAGHMSVQAIMEWLPMQTLVFSMASVAMVISSFGLAILLKERADASNHALAFTDDLTGLYNRRYVRHALEQQIAYAQRLQQPLSLLIVDVDFFKRINDAYGHLCGDQVLQDLATCLKTQLRSGDIAGRWGGEEFIFILSHTDAIGASALAERLRATAQKKRFVTSDGSVHSVTVSIGLHTLNRGGSANGQTMLAAADKALYLAKNTGRNCVVTL